MGGRGAGGNFGGDGTIPRLDRMDVTGCVHLPKSKAL